MTGQHVFSGGWLDLRRLLAALGGRPLQADLEEVFTPRAGGEVKRRHGRVWVDTRRRVRLDVQEEGQPLVMFCFDGAGQSLTCGVVDQPETWVSSPWPMSFDADVPPAAEPPSGQAFRVEVTDADGAHLYRLFNERYEEPDAGVFPGGGSTTTTGRP
jgi:hypothetical protein